MRFVHCADLHLDSPLRGLDRYEGAPASEMRDATRRAFENIVDLAIDREASFVLIAGDVFDGDLLDFNAGLYLANQLRRLGDVNIPVLIVRGNHDALSKLTKSVPWPKNVHVFTTAKPESFEIDGLDVVVHGQSFANAAVTDDLAAAYPGAVPGKLNIGLLHTALSGREGHEPYAPTTLDKLNAKGYQYWALGHIHLREVVQESPCWVVFPGNTQGRHARELGEKGCVLVEFAAGEIVDVEFVATDVARWASVVVDAADLVSLDELAAAIQRAVQDASTNAGDRVIAVRLTIRGRTPLHGHLVTRPEGFRADVCAWMNDATGGMAWLEKLRVEVSAPLDLAALAARDDPFGFLIRRLDELAGDPAALSELVKPRLAELHLKIPPELRVGDPHCDPLSDVLQREALEAARQRLLGGLSAEDLK